MSFAFDYQRVGKRFFPIVPIKVGMQGKFVETKAYVDSGASISVFHTIIAELSGIDYKKGEIVYPKGTAGHIKAYKIRAEVILNESIVECNMLFSDELVSKFNLLGLQGVFDRFKITFDNKNKKIFLKSINCSDNL